LAAKVYPPSQRPDNHQLLDSPTVSDDGKSTQKVQKSADSRVHQGDVILDNKWRVGQKLACTDVMGREYRK